MNNKAGDLPPLTSHRMLPEGVHPGSLEAIHERFGQFQKSDRRCNLFKNLVEFVQEVRDAGWGAEIIVDGSFVMGAVDEPGDIDIILVLPRNWDMGSEVKPFEYNLLSRRRTRKRFGFDVLAVRSDSEEEQKSVEFFHQVNVKWNNDLGLPVGLKKGIVKVICD